MANSESEIRERAKRVADALNGFVGALHGARCTGVVWAHHAENLQYRLAAKYALQNVFGIVALTLRKFEDLWTHHLRVLIPDISPSRAYCENLIAECNDRNLRQTTNRLIAHYAPGTRDFPLSRAEIASLIKSNKWNTDEEVIHWIGEIMPKLISVRDELMHCYGIEKLTDERVTI